MRDRNQPKKLRLLIARVSFVPNLSMVKLQELFRTGKMKIERRKQ